MSRINGTTRLAGVIGHPISHSLSPAMHNAAYAEMGLDWVYVPLEVEDSIGLRRLVAAVRSMRFVGFNITMPFKQEVFELCDEVAMAAQMAGAVNTVHCTDGRLVGYNTDGRGLLESLETETGFKAAGKHIVILGAGGAAGAAFVAFILARAESVTIVNRDPYRAEELVARMSPHLGAVRSESVSYSEAEEVVRAADLIVNSTPVGMKADDPSPIPVEWLGPGQVCYDMIYGTPVPTALVSGARARGAQALDGAGMLVCQGATAIDIWNVEQNRAPRDVMRAAVQEQLAARTRWPGDAR